MTANACVKKILLLGPDKSGKTAIATTLCNEQNTMNYTPTIGVSFRTFTFDQTKILLWDCAGLSHFRSLWSLFLSGAHGIIFVIDGTDSFSLVEGILWVQEMCPTRIPLLIFINKQDLSNAINPASIQTILSNYGIQVEGGTIFNKQVLIEKIQKFLERIPNCLSLEKPHKKDYSQEAAVFVI